MVIFEVFFALICKWLEQLFCYNMSIMGSLSRICGTFKVKSLFLEPFRDKNRKSKMVPEIPTVGNYICYCLRKWGG